MRRRGASGVVVTTAFRSHSGTSAFQTTRKLECEVELWLEGKHSVKAGQSQSKLVIVGAEVGELSQHSTSLRIPYPAGRKLCVLLLLLCTHKESPKLFGGNLARPRSTERIEDQITLSGRGQDGAAHEA